jgi:hypothetical protein
VFRITGGGWMVFGFEFLGSDTIGWVLISESLEVIVRSQKNG